MVKSNSHPVTHDIKPNHPMIANPRPDNKRMCGFETEFKGVSLDTRMLDQGLSSRILILRGRNNIHCRLNAVADFEINNEISGYL